MSNTVAQAPRDIRYLRRPSWDPYIMQISFLLFYKTREQSFIADWKSLIDFLSEMEKNEFMIYGFHD